jgi:c-di-GMP-binding flagellar brake protein YcgR
MPLINPQNLRSEERKQLHCATRVLFKDMPAMTGKAADLSPSGMCILLPESLENGKECLITFETTVSGKQFSIKVRANPVYSICSGDVFRIGFKFDRVDDATAASLQALHKVLFI